MIHLHVIKKFIIKHTFFSSLIFVIVITDQIKQKSD